MIISMNACQPQPDIAMQRRVLRRLREPRALLIVARDVETCGVIIPHEDGTIPRAPVAGCSIGEALTLLDAGWIEPVNRSDRISRWRITDSGRAHVTDLLNRQRARLDGRAPSSETLIKWSAQRHLRRAGRIV